VLVNGFVPCGEHEEPTGDEIVIFNPAQILPRYLGTFPNGNDHNSSILLANGGIAVRYEIKKKAKFAPISLMNSDDDNSDEGTSLSSPSFPPPLTASQQLSLIRVIQTRKRMRRQFRKRTREFFQQSNLKAKKLFTMCDSNHALDVLLLLFFLFLLLIA
jgi:hypothetical protein